MLAAAPSTPRSRFRNRRLRILLLAVVLGLLTTVTVAWAFAVLRPPYNNGSHLVVVGWRFDEHGGRVGVMVDQCNGTSAVRSQRSADATFGKQFGPEYSAPEECLPRWARSRVLPWFDPVPGRAPPASPEWRDVMAHGWPMPCLWCESGVWPTPTSAPPPYMGALRFPLRPRPGVSPYFLPYRPLWPGLLINTTFAAGVWWLILTFAPVLVNRFRTPPGHCQTCRYDLRGLTTATCPECGKPAPQPVSPPPPSRN